MTATTIDPDSLRLDSGNHSGPTDGHCLMEAVSMFAKEPFGDAPKCVSPYLRSFGITLNDRATDHRRQDLRQFIPLVVGTAGDGLDDVRRWLAVDHVTHITTPRWLDAAGLHQHADALRALPPITDYNTYSQSRTVVYAARDAAYQLQRDTYGGKTRYRFIYDAVLAKLSEGKTADATTATATAAAAAAATDAATAAADAATAAAAATATDAATAAADAAADAATATTDAATATATATATADAATATATAAAAADGVPAYGTDAYWAWRDELRNQVYAKVRAVYEERYADLLAESWTDAINLYRRLINPVAS